MATTESRSGFRLPWSADRAASRDETDDRPDGDTGVVGSEAAELEASDAEAPDMAVVAEPDAPPAPGASSAEVATATAAVQPAASGTSDLPAAPVAQPAPGRRPTKFMVDLTHAMQVAAEQARAATLEQFRVDGSSYVEQIQGRSVSEADALRRRADEDVAAIKDWSKAEIARIREETDHRIAGRRGQLDGQLARHATLIEAAVARIEGQIASFETEMAAFFDELLAETDLSVLAARAQQMPEAPAFDPPDESAYAALLAEPAVGVPVIEPEPAAEIEPVAEAEPGAAEPITDEESRAAIVASLSTDTPFDRDAAMAAIQAAAEAAAALEASNAEDVDTQAPVEATAAHDETAPANDPRLAMLGLSPAFAAAEEAAAEAAAAEIQEIPEMGEEDLTARLAGLVPRSTSGPAPAVTPGAPVISTQVVVTGLISVASIAGFKRQLSRGAGVRHVGVSSGPDGEFLFTVQHEDGVSLRDLIPTLPGFQARVTGGGEGIITASAHDPED